MPTDTDKLTELIQTDEGLDRLIRQAWEEELDVPLSQQPTDQQREEFARIYEEATGIRPTAILPCDRHGAG